VGSGALLGVNLGKGDHAITMALDDGTAMVEDGLTIIAIEDKEEQRGCEILAQRGAIQLRSHPSSL